MKKKLSKSAETFEIIVGGILLTLITMVVLVQIVGRLMGLNVSVSVELSRFSQVWMVYIGMAGAVYTNSHVGVLLFEKHMSTNSKIIRRILIGALTLFMFGFLTYSGMLLFLQTIKAGTKWTTADIPYFINHLPLPLGSLLGILRIIQSTIRDMELIKKYDTGDIRVEMLKEEEVS